MKPDIARIATDLSNANTSHNKARITNIHIGASDRLWWNALCDIAKAHNVKATTLAKAILKEAVLA